MIVYTNKNRRMAAGFDHITVEYNFKDIQKRFRNKFQCR